MTKKAKNSPIGEVECSHKGCTKVCKVYRFRQRTEGRTSVFSGKHYAECPVHGRIGSDGNQASTDYILEHGTIWGAKDQAGAGPEKPAKNPAGAPASAPASKPSKGTATGSGPTSSNSSSSRTPSRPWWQPLID